MSDPGPEAVHFPHRLNHNGTIDSICPKCFATIGTSMWEADLDRSESRHICESWRLAQFNRIRRDRVKQKKKAS
jgi:hypothetical protein